jgi:hypothetical protein
MDDQFYASLLETSTPTNSTQPVLLSVILSRKTLTHSNQANSSVRLAVVARIPRKRLDCTDSVKYTLQYFSFLDDRRRFTNLDALLTRLSPVSVVHLSSIESAEVSDYLLSDLTVTYSTFIRTITYAERSQLCIISFRSLPSVIVFTP